MQQIDDLNRLRRNTESFLLGFLRFTTSQKPPFPDSWLGFDLDRNNYVFMVLRGHMEYTRGYRMVFYPDGTNRVLLTPETKWLYRVYDEVNFGGLPDRDAYLRDVASRVQPILVSKLEAELAYFKGLLSVRNGEAVKRTKTLF